MSGQRPNQYLNWTDGDPSKVAQIPSNFALQGWQAGMAPPFQYMNELFYLTDLWIKYLDPLVTEGFPDQAMRLLNGGTWSFNASTGVLAWSAAFDIVIPSVPDSANETPAGSVVLNDGDIAYVVLNTPVQVSGDTQSGSPLIQNVSFTNQITTGMNITGPGIPNGATVITVAPTSVTISANATATAVGVSLVFSGAGPLVALTAASASFVPTVTTILFARRSGAVIYLGVNASQMLIRDKEFKPLLGSGYFTVYEAPAGQNLTAGQLVYISPGGSGDAGRTAGSLYPLDVSSGNQAVRGGFEGVIISDVTSGGTAEVLFNGFYEYTGLTAGAVYYADPANPGGFTLTQPTGSGQRIVQFGAATSSTVMIVNSSGSGSGQLNFPIFFNETIGAGDGSTTAFNLTEAPLNDASLLIFVDGLLLPKTWSRSGQVVTLNVAPATGQSIYAEYVLAGQSYITANQDAPIEVPNGVITEFSTAGTPLNQYATMVFLDGELISRDQWALILSDSGNKIRFNTAPATGQQVYFAYFTASPAGGSGSGGVSGAANIGSGSGIFSGLVSGILNFKSLVAGAGITLTPSGSTIAIAATGGGGGGSIDVHGSASSPIAIGTSGLTPSSSMDQIWFTASTGGSVTVTANPQIVAGTTVGQRLKLKGTSSSNFVIFADGNGLSLNGPCTLNNNQTIELSWDGLVWNEDNRRS